MQIFTNSPSLSQRESLLSPMMAAAYLTWLAVCISLLMEDGAGTGVVVDIYAKTTALALHLLFLLAFVAGTLHLRALPYWQPVMLALQTLLVLMLCSLERNTTLPVLSIMVVPQWCERYGLRIGAGIALLFNAVLWWILHAIWKLPGALVWVMVFSGFQGFSIITLLTMNEGKRQRDQLATLNAELLATRHLLATGARDQERLRLARELHDIAGHKLTALKLQLTALQADASDNSSSLTLCRRLATELLDDIRGVVLHMRNDEGVDLAAMLAQQISAFPRPQVELQIDAGARPRSMAQAETLMRAVQEGITNAARHSDATRLTIRLECKEGQLVLSMEDDGKAPEHISPGNGLRGMQERFEALGGSLRVTHTASRGLSLHAQLPLQS